MQKRLICLVLLLAIMCGIMPKTASASVPQPPRSYRWEIENNAWICIADDGNSENPLTLTSGSVTGGTLTGVRCTLETPVRLLHDAPWVLKWRSTGNWSGMLLSSAYQSPSEGLTYLFRDPNSKLFAFGEYNGQWNNYGSILELDMTVAHTFRLENRIAPDGSNTVYLLVDGQQIGAMDRHYILGKDQNTTVNWANGKDLELGYIGTSSHSISAMKLDYLQIWESYHDHVYENGLCTLCAAKEPSPYAGKTIACIGDSITAGVGVTKDQTDYVTLLAKSLDMNYIRLGASGSTLCDGGHAACNISKLTEKNLAGADVVTVLMGINDFVQARQGYYTLGSVTSTDTSTVYGAVHAWCQRIQALRQTEGLKDTEFYFMTPVITSWNNSVSSVRNWDQSKQNIYGYTLRDLCNAIIEVCALYNIPVIDLNLISGLYYNSAEDNTVAEFAGDGAHPGAVGHQMMAAAIRKALLKEDQIEDHTHQFGSWITTTYPGENEGREQRVCTVCTATESRTLPALLPQVGDMNGDGNVNIADVAQLYIFIKKDLTLEDLGALRADLNNDTRLTILDVVLVYCHVKGSRPLW